MFKIRKGLFENNSSSTHSLTMCAKEDYEKWKNGKVYFCEDGKFYTKEELIKEIESCKWYKDGKGFLESLDEETFNSYAMDYEYYTYNNYNDEYLEEFYVRICTGKPPLQKCKNYSLSLVF